MRTIVTCNSLGAQDRARGAGAAPDGRRVTLWADASFAYVHVYVSTIYPGVGKAVAFGLIGLKADVIRCVDLDSDKAEALARTGPATDPSISLRPTSSRKAVTICHQMPKRL